MTQSRFWTSVAIVVVVVLGLVFAGVWYTNYEVREANREWCDLLITLDSPIPPEADNPRARDIAGKLHVLRVRFDC